MKHLISLLLTAFSGVFAFAQNTEFESYSNGLIYSDTTVTQLKYIVDSLNLKFKVCDLDKVYLSIPQAKAHYISLEKRDVKAAKEDIEAGISYDAFVQKYARAKTEKDLLIQMFKYQDYEKQDVVALSSLEFNGSYGCHFEVGGKHLNEFDKPLVGKWIMEYSEKSKYNPESIRAIYFTEDFLQRPMPEKYARMIQYSDCMIDTSTQVFYESAQRNGLRYSSEQGPAMATFTDYVNKATPKPEYDENDSKKSRKDYELWDSLRFVRVDSLNKNDARFQKLLKEAVTEALETGVSDDEFETYVEWYDYPKNALELKRNRIVEGYCSMDERPRIHALNIARLSAETINWELFLRAHLDIMNDRFERASDGSYAWEGRQTYIRELEVLDINVLDLLLGISLRIENPSKNHYFGSIGRLGRALSETLQPDEIEAKMLEMISDNDLDDYNRVLMYFLFLNYNYNLEDEGKQAKNKEKLASAVSTLPAYLSSKISIK